MSLPPVTVNEIPPPRRHRLRWAAFIAFLLVGGLVVGGWLIYQHQLQQYELARHRAFTAWSTALLKAVGTKTLPDGAGSVTPAKTEGVLAGFAKDQNLPRPPKQAAALQYQAAGGRFVLCSTKLTAKKAEFVTNDNSYELKSAGCHDHPSVVAAKFTQQIELTNQAISTLFISNPQVLPKAQIKARCSDSADAQTSVLGCYDREIYVVNINVPEIDGEMDVIAAHELLHAEYDLLSTEDRKHVDQLVEAQAKQVDDPQLKEILTHYSSPQHASELHSRFGTEFGNLSPELEQYYQRYFKNRAKLVSEHANYVAVLNGLSKQIDALKADLNSKKAASANLLARGRVAEYNAQVGAYNEQVSRVNQLVDHYNQLTIHTR